MKPSALAFPGHKINQYLLVLSLQPILRNNVLPIKEECYKAGQAKNDGWDEPYFTLATFNQYAMMESRIVSKLKATGMGQQPFTVMLKHGGSFAFHTIDMDVAKKEPVRQLVKAIRLQHECMALNPSSQPHFCDMSRTAIAQQLSKGQFDSQWPGYNKMTFDGEWLADSMLLFRRPAGTTAAYQLVEKIEFLYQSVDAGKKEVIGKK